MTRLCALVLALVVHLLTLAFVALGGWIILREPGSILSWLLGGVSLAIGWALRPRLGRLPADADMLDRAAAPELYAVADRVADRVGVKRPSKVAVRDLATRTGYDRIGVARTPVLVVGLPLWLALSPKQRVALLARTYARLPTGDERVVTEALATLECWRDALVGPGAGPLQARSDAQDKIATTAPMAYDAMASPFGVTGLLGRLVGRVLGGPVLLTRYVLTRLARAGESRVQARHRALALRVATEEELAELETLEERGGYVAPMQAAALRGESVSAIRRTVLTKFQLTADGVFPSAPHSELLGNEQSDRIDEELAAHYARAIRGFGLIS
ncbi:M48 family metallopeptidase [[Actinomadura] parvosata]|uniref:M48 family metallopeptidase n=1 Tax=[Actinomadura] parvosata TaxID=1955412 RepID=UPI0012BBFADD|nr:M48 family metallopeptidase [Nonomuraea sp. ATCC 55076]